MTTLFPCTVRKIMLFSNYSIFEMEVGKVISCVKDESRSLASGCRFSVAGGRKKASDDQCVFKPGTAH